MLISRYTRGEHILFPYSAKPAYLVILLSECTYETLLVRWDVSLARISTIPVILDSLDVVDGVLAAKGTVY